MKNNYIFFLRLVKYSNTDQAYNIKLIPPYKIIQIGKIHGGHFEYLDREGL